MSHSCIMYIRVYINMHVNKLKAHNEHLMFMMYVCMYVCMFVCLYVRMYVCTVQL